ncbi:MAG: pilus assembly protein PilO [Methylococcaceae bacterium]|nr:MAG: pilus assembly protein PilO [Methylococcaceae bacterium]
MNFSEIVWDINYVGRWPWPVKGMVILVVSLLVAGAWFYVDTKGQLDELDKAQRKETELRTNFETGLKKAASLEEYKKQLQEMEKIFGDMLRQLPDKTQVAELLVDVSQTGLASGLEFELFKPLAEAKKDFYAELPIDVRVIGTYAKFGTFVSGLAALPRIVTIHNVHIKRPTSSAKAAPAEKRPGGDATLIMETQVKTYRYMDEGEESAATPKKPGAGGRPAPGAKPPAKPPAPAPAKGK